MGTQLQLKIKCVNFYFENSSLDLGKFYEDRNVIMLSKHVQAQDQKKWTTMCWV